FTDCFFTDQNIALTGMMLPYYMSGPVIAFMSSEGTSLSFCIDDRHLAQTSAWIVRNELVDDFFRRQAFFQQCQSLRSKSGIRPGLCGNCAYIGFCPWNHRSDCQKLRLDSDAHFSGFRICCDN